MIRLELVKAQVMARSLDDHLVRADTVHQIVKAEGAPAEGALHVQPGLEIGDYAHLPTRTVGGRPRRANRKDLRRRQRLVGFTEGAEDGLVGDPLEVKLAG